MYLEGLTCTGLDPLLHLNASCYVVPPFSSAMNFKVTLHDDYQVKLSALDVTMEFNSFQDCNSLYSQMEGGVEEISCNWPETLRLPLMNEARYDDTLLMSRIQDKREIVEELGKMHSFFSNADHLVDLLESDAIERIRGSFHPRNVIEMERLYLFPYASDKFITGFVDKATCGGSLITFSKDEKVIQYRIPSDVNVKHLYESYSELSLNYAAKKISKLSYVLNSIALCRKMFWRIFKNRKEIVMKSNFSIGKYVLNNLRLVWDGMSCLINFVLIGINKRIKKLQMQMVEKIELPRYQKIGFMLQNVRRPVQQAQVFITQFGQGNSSHRHVVHVQKDGNTKHTTVQETASTGGRSDWSVDEKNNLVVGLSENNQTHQKDGDLFVGKYAVTEEEKPCIILLHIPKHSQIFPGKFGDKGRASDVNPVWIKSFRVEDGGHIVFDEEEFSNGERCQYCEGKTDEKKQWADHVASPCKHKACKQCWGDRTECMQCGKRIEKLFEIKKIPKPITHAYSHTYDSSTKFKYTVNQPLHEPNFHPDRDRYCIEGTPGFYFNVNLKNNFNWMPKKQFKFVSPGDWSVLNPPSHDEDFHDE